MHIHIIEGPIGRARPDWEVKEAGAVVCFDGIVRGWETVKGKRVAIAGLKYEAYEPMAVKELRRLAEEAVTRHDLLGVKVEHSRGFVPAGKCSFRLHLAGRHRQETLAAMGWFIDQMKRDVPIWKAPVLAEMAAALPQGEIP